MHCQKLPAECASEWLDDEGSRPFLSSVSAHRLCGCSLGQLFRWDLRFRCDRNHWPSTQGWPARQGLVENCIYEFSKREVNMILAINWFNKFKHEHLSKKLSNNYIYYSLKRARLLGSCKYYYFVEHAKMWASQKSTWYETFTIVTRQQPESWKRYVQRYLHYNRSIY